MLLEEEADGVHGALRAPAGAASVDVLRRFIANDASLRGRTWRRTSRATSREAKILRLKPVDGDELRAAVVETPRRVTGHEGLLLRIALEESRRCWIQATRVFDRADH